MDSENYMPPQRGGRFTAPLPTPETISLRDWFAGMVLSAVYASTTADPKTFVYDDWPTGLAMDAYRMADAMLAAREGGEHE